MATPNAQLITLEAQLAAYEQQAADSNLADMGRSFFRARAQQVRSELDALRNAVAAEEAAEGTSDLGQFLTLSPENQQRAAEELAPE